MKIITITALLLTLFTTNCVITDLMVQPTDSIRGGDLKKDIANSASLGFLAGVAQNPNAATMVQTLGSASGNMITASLLAGNTATRNLGIDEKKYYTNTSANDCKTAMFNAYFGAMVAGLEPPPLTGSAIGKELCNLKTTGKIIHVNDRISL